MKRIVLLILMTWSISAMSQEKLDIAGKVKISTMDVSDSDSIVVWNSDGTLARREASTLSELQVLSISNDTIYLSGGDFVKLPAEVDGDVTNEKITALAVIGDSLSITEGGITMKVAVDSSNVNELQMISRTRLTVSLTNGGGSYQDSVLSEAAVGIMVGDDIQDSIEVVKGILQDTSSILRSLIADNRDSIRAIKSLVIDSIYYIESLTNAPLRSLIIRYKDMTSDTLIDALIPGPQGEKGEGVSASPYCLGKDTLGGIVFYVYKGTDGMDHGLIVSKTETTAQWQSTGNLSTTDANRTWDGVYNTNLMTNSPAKTWITANFTGEWYLPSIDELSLLWHNRFHANKGLSDASATLLSTSAYYWSSTEFNATDAWAFNFSNGSSSNGPKAGTVSVRSIRAF